MYGVTETRKRRTGTDVTKESRKREMCVKPVRKTGEARVLRARGTVERVPAETGASMRSVR